MAALISGASNAYAKEARTLAASGNSPYIQLQAAHSGKCLTIKDSTMQEGPYAVQMNCTEGADNQLFSLRSQQKATFQVIAKHSGRCLSSGEDFDWKAGQRWCFDFTDTNDHNSWTIVMVQVADRLYELRPVEAPDYCLTVYAASTGDGAKAHIGLCDGDSSQRWRIKQP
ncbi:RICIN domain-containing protein [Streptomyces ehimensis]|uniref:RICIN domain-containing protein n=1 Tax=Streptomyces ehimensis TaxID=68195 RepID=A0ABV9BU07_9ACTN